MGSDEFKMRLQKANDLKKEGVIVYKSKFGKTHFGDEIAALSPQTFRKAEDVLKSPSDGVGFAGRVMTKRDHGGIIFLDLQDMFGIVQVAITDKVAGDNLEFVRNSIDPGDFVGARGELFMTKQEKVALHTREVVFLSKALNSLPSKHFGVEDIEIRYRKRYLDLIFNEEVKDRFIKRSKMVESLRQYLLKDRFIELVTRTLQPVAGGALAETFITHHNALNHDFHLRISNELDLKMAVAGGFERVFEFAIDFRNEGIDSSHLQEFQMLEWYAAYEDYEMGIDRSTKMLLTMMEDVFGTTTFNIQDKEGSLRKVTFSKDIPRITFKDLLAKYDIDIWSDKGALLKYITEKELDIENADVRSRGNLLDEVYKKVIRPDLIDPIYITHHPSDTLPLARRSDNDESIVDSYQLVVGTWEIVKGYSELVDPQQQRLAFENQQKARTEGDKEAMETHNEYLLAMQHGFPPIGGFGMGIDRIVALLTGASNLKETTLFPLLLPEGESDVV